MKNKLNIKAKMLSAAVVTAAFFVGITPMTAYAGGPDCPIEESQPDDPETVAEEPETPEKPEEHYGPLTPDGNMDLVDDYGSVEAGGKQFITVVTKAGNYFYIIIDRDDDGNENVHFLNLVDEADLLSLMDDEEVDKYIAATKPEEETPVEPEVTEPTPTPEPELVEPEPEKSSHLGLMAFLLLGTATAIGAFIYLKKTKDTKKPADDYDPDADYDESEENYLDSLPDDLDDDYETMNGEDGDE